MKKIKDTPTAARGTTEITQDLPVFAVLGELCAFSAYSAVKLSPNVSSGKSS